MVIIYEDNEVEDVDTFISIGLRVGDFVTLQLKDAPKSLPTAIRKVNEATELQNFLKNAPLQMFNIKADSVNNGIA